jgi:hypothetical protein
MEKVENWKDVPDNAIIETIVEKSIIGNTIGTDKYLWVFKRYDCESKSVFTYPNMDENSYSSVCIRKTNACKNKEVECTFLRADSAISYFETKKDRCEKKNDFLNLGKYSALEVTINKGIKLLAYFDKYKDDFNQVGVFIKRFETNVNVKYCCKDQCCIKNCSSGHIYSICFNKEDVRVVNAINKIDNLNVRYVNIW